MRPRYSFSSKHSKRATESSKMRKQRGKYPELLKRIIETSDIILEVLDARFIKETRNLKFEKEIKDQNKEIIYVLNKSDLLTDEKLRAIKNFKILQPNIPVSCEKRAGIKNLRDKIKAISKKIDKPLDTKYNKITVGVIGYPNTGKSSVINLLIGRNSAPVGSQAGFTKGIQKLRLSQDIVILDSPGVIPEAEYSSSDREALARHTKVGGRSYSQIKDPEMSLAYLMKEYAEQIEKLLKYEIQKRFSFQSS
ncbi:50S ribosome-binding GTPase [Candidatus Pacearchaeota archaeon]|nr:50S ribosome-binding GTPase [Candidatus Pacearchaeota archaeon]